MQVSWNPAAVLREQAGRGLIGMLRFDRTGRALLVSDMPARAGGATALDAAARLDARAWIENRLLFIDLTPEAYAGLLSFDCNTRGEWQKEWFEVQSLLAGILCRRRESAEAADEPLLRMALLASATGERPVRDFCTLLREKDAAALRTGNTASCRAAAAFMAQWLWTERAVGLPPMIFKSDEK